MAKDKEENVTEFNSGIYTDCNPIDQPKGSYRFALNAVEETIDGNQRKLSNEASNYDASSLPDGFLPIGERYIGNNTNAIILVNPITYQEKIGIVDKKNDKYIGFVDTAVLGLKVTNQCDIIYRLRRGNERVIYWVDGLNFARTFNFDKVHAFYSSGFKDYLQAGNNPDNYVGEKWNKDSFNLIKTYESIPFFSNVEIIETGSTFPGSYSFAIQYVDEDLNPTEWITTSNTVNIYNDPITNPYERIRGSRNVDNSAQSFPRANKSIKLTLTNLDNSFPYYRVAIIRAAGGTGEPDKVLASELYSTSNSNFLYSGNDGELKDIALEEILIGQDVIFAPRHIEQIENRCVLGYTEGKHLNLCDFQKFASKIKSDLVTKEVLLNNVQSDANVKNAKSTFVFGGYMPGEVHSFGVSYVFPDYITPAYHIPGKNKLDTISLMMYHEIDDKYLDIHNCSSSNYWGLDAYKQTLVGKKIRHHRFPFRKDVNKPLVTTDSSVTNITRYRLRLTFTLKTGQTYPLDTNNLPLVIRYAVNYQVATAAGTNNYNSQLVDSDLGVSLSIYDDTLALSPIGSAYYTIDPTSELNSYISKFDIAAVYESYTLNSTINNDKAEIFGIRFDNIEKPHPDCIGFYIVRNERTDDDKLIVDNAIFGSMTEFEQYKSFGLLTPKQYYIVDNCGAVGTPNKTVNFYNKGSWFFNPEFQYLRKKTEFDEVVVEGSYTETHMDMPTLSNIPNRSCNVGETRALYIQDVQAGTSYDPNINKAKNKDDDGFDLVVGYRNIDVQFGLNNTNITLPTKSKVMYLNAASYQNYNSNTYYNVSVDNKIGIYATDGIIDMSKFRDNATNKNSFLYGSLVRHNNSSYSNFLIRPYYKEHNNPILFNGLNIINNVNIYNGDADISAMHLVSSVYYDMVVADRPKKSSIWKIVVGAVLVVAAVVATVATGGLAAPLAVVAASSLAVSYGVSLLASGIKFEQFKSMVDVDYLKGLKDTVTDGGVFETIRENVGNTTDDTIRWFADRISNVYIESSVPVGLRSGLTSGVPDFIDAPSIYNELEFRSYLTEKLTTLDRNQGSGRLYKGYASAEIYDINQDYMRINKQKLFIHLPLEYDCCSSGKEIYPTRRWFSQQSFQEEKVDNYAVFLPNNYNDMEGEQGALSDIFRLGNVLFMHTTEGLWQQPANLQERVTNEIVSFIGTGNFLEIPPRKVVDDNLGSAGTQHKWATIKTPFGVFFISEMEGKPYLHGEKPLGISAGNSDYFEEVLKGFLNNQLYNKLGVEFKNNNNPANPFGVGYVSNYDSRFERLIFTKIDYLVVQDKLNILTLKYTRPLNGDDFSYCIEDGLFYKGTVVIRLDNPLYFEDKGFTMSFSFKSKKWVSWHSYRPNFYISSHNNFYSYVAGSNKIWKHHKEGSYQNFYGKQNPFIIEYIISTQLQTSILNDLIIQTVARKFDNTTKEYFDDRFVTFNSIVVSNNKQCSGELRMIVKDTQAQSNEWYNQQVINNYDVLITEKEGNWNINDIRDYVIDNTKPIFTKSWDKLKENYFIDKIVNSEVINFDKNWYELQSFKGKYASIRLKFDTFDNVNLIVNYSIELSQPSYR